MPFGGFGGTAAGHLQHTTETFLIRSSGGIFQEEAPLSAAAFQLAVQSPSAPIWSENKMMTTAKSG